MKRLPLISIIDDDPSICRAVKRLVESAHMHAMSHSSVADFVENGLCHRPDCIIVDIHMPVTNGIDIRSRLRGDTANVPIVFISAHESEDVKERVRQDRNADYLGKPFRDEQLISAIQNLIGRVQEQSPDAEREPEIPGGGRK